MFSRSQDLHKQSGSAAEPCAEAVGRLLLKTPLLGSGPTVARWLVHDLDRLYAQAVRELERTSIFAGLLDGLKITCECSPDDARRIPAQGPVVVVANHPFGLAEGPVLGEILLRVRTDIKFLANSLLASVPGLQNYIFPVNPFGGGTVSENWKSLRQSLEWLRGGGLLVVFPAGEVASFQFPGFEIADPVWSDSVARLIRLTSASALPVFFHGANSAAFHAAGLVHPGLRTVLLPWELLNKRGRTIRVSIGGPIRPERFLRLPANRDAVKYLRGQTQLLGARRGSLGAPPPKRPFALKARSKQSPILAPIDSRCLRTEAEQLPAAQKLLTSGEYVVCLAQAQQIPKSLLEIGRLREISFREAGEGTGSALDLDTFDARYHHLFVWNRERDQIVGAYRLAGTDAMLARFGHRGLYTSTLFRFKTEFLSCINPALELGRSFVRPEYQRTYLPLLLLWKGIGHFVAENPRYRILFGPVSISKQYCPASRALMVAFLKARCWDAKLAPSVRPKNKFRALRGCEIGMLGPLLGDVEELSELVADLEPDKKGVPVLLRQYLNVGGRFLDFSVDGNFSDVLDGLVMVDLAKADRRLLERYLGKVGAERFSFYHSQGSTDGREPSVGMQGAIG